MIIADSSESKEGIMSFICLIAASIGGTAPTSSVGHPARETVHVTKELLIGISDDLIKADIAEVDIDPAVFDLPVETKPKKKSSVEEVEFISEIQKSPITEDKVLK